MNTKVYILGAGASKPNGVPLMDEFISGGIREWCDNEDIIKGLFEFVNRTYRYQIKIPLIGDIPNQEMFVVARLLDNDKKIGIEGLLSKAIEIGDGKAEITIKNFIYETIEKSSSQCRHMRNFVANKIKKDIQGDFNIVFVSFNYDILLERALLYNSLNDKFSYMISSFERQTNMSNYYMKNYGDEIKLLKPHGSLNWSSCEKCGNIQHIWFQRYKDIGNYPCKKCQGKRLTHLLIAPVKNKVHNDIFEALWIEAEKCLKETIEIIVIGYSFRETDKEARDRIGNAIAGNPNSPMLTIVDKNPNEIRKKVLEISGTNKDNFRQIEQFCSFEEFLAREVAMEGINGFKKGYSAL